MEHKKDKTINANFLLTQQTQNTPASKNVAESTLSKYLQW